MPALIQDEFDLRPKTPPPVASSDVERLCAYLHARPEWITAKQLAQALDLSDRRIRQLAEHSAGRIVSGPGCPGYRHLEHCTVEQLGHTANQLISQGKAMIRRGVRIKIEAKKRIS